MAKYPRGKLRPDDEGEFEMGVTVEQDVVVIAFEKSVTWIGLPAETAEQLADVLKARAAEARRNRM